MRKIQIINFIWNRHNNIIFYNFFERILGILTYLDSLPLSPPHQIHWFTNTHNVNINFEIHNECLFVRYKNGKRINVTTIALNECIGFYKRFRICNEMVSVMYGKFVIPWNHINKLINHLNQNNWNVLIKKNCPQENVNVHAEQCSSFNNQKFRGIQYEWEPYVKGIDYENTWFAFLERVLSSKTFSHTFRRCRMRIELQANKSKVFRKARRFNWWSAMHKSSSQHKLVVG